MGRLMDLVLARGMLATLLSTACVGLGSTLWALWDANRLNQAIASPSLNATFEPGQDDPLLGFAMAYQAQQQHQPLEAIHLYGLILEQPGTLSTDALRYNLGTLYLEDAFKLWKAQGLHEYVRINTLLGASKDHLKQALEINPDNLDARFNLELAYRITPPPKEHPKNDFQGNKGSVFATLPAIPGGGP